jgi:polyisoprenoid-binding protein YceI
MLKMTKLLSTILILLSATTGYSQTTWSIDKTHSSIRFAATHMLISEVVGKFNDFGGTIVSADDAFAGSTIEFTAQAASIDTDNERRDNHLRSEDFFNAETHPEIKFIGKLVKESDQYFLVGDFTMAGTTKEIKFDVKYLGKIQTKRGGKAGFKVTGTINRFDYGLKWNSTIEAGGLVVGEDIDITCNLEIKEVVE